MTVSSTNSKHIYNGNGVTVNWPYTFTIINTSDIKVYLTNTDAEVSEITTGFTVDELNSRVVYPAVGSGVPVLPTGWKITLVREMDLTQLLDLTRQGPLDSESLEEAYDKLTLIAQQHDEQISRCIIWAIDSTPSTVDTTAYLEQIQAERTAAETAATAAETAQGLAETAQAAAETAQGLAETAETNAETAQTAAELAETNAELAQAAAEAARDLALGYRNAASGYATTATTQASAASGFATTATTQAGIATTQAANALSSAQDAETAKTAAETAQGLAEDAQDAAEAAQTAAETAQGLAESARDTAITNAGTATTQAGLATSAKDDALLAQAAAESARDLASGYKDTATTQAGLATSAKDDAVLAKTAAETAQGLAEDAKDDAVIAKNAAEAAAALLAAGTFDNELTIKQITTPANPSAGYNKLYVKSDNKFYTKDSSGNELAVGSGSGGGGVNYVGNGDFESNADGWYIYNDGASATPVDGTGGDISANYLTIARTTTAGQILRGNASGKLSKTANNAQGWGLGYPIVIAAADKCKPLQFKLSYLTLDANYSYANEDIRAWVYDVDNSQLIPVTPYQFDGSGAFLGEFQTTTSLNYRILLHVATTNANAYDIAVDDVSVGPAHFVYGNLQDKQYDISSYVSGTNSFSVTRAIAIPTKTKDGVWKLNFRITGTISSASSGTVSITGITSKNLSNYYQALSIEAWGNSVSTIYQSFRPNSNTLEYAFSGNATTIAINGESIELDSMPTWATDFYPVQLSDGAETMVTGVRAYLNSNQTGVNTNGTFVKINLNATSYDTHSIFNTALYKGTITVAGKYKLSGQIALTGTNTLTNGYQAMLYVNGVLYSQGATVYPYTAGTAMFMPVSDTANLNVNDYVELYLFGSGNNSVNTLTVDGRSSVTFLNINRESGPATIAASEKINCRYTGSNGASLSSTAVAFIPSTKDYDTHSILNISTGVITFPVSGKYKITLNAFTATSATGDNQSLEVSLRTGTSPTGGTAITTRTAYAANGCYQPMFPFIFTYNAIAGAQAILGVLSTMGASRTLYTNTEYIDLTIEKLD